MSVNSKPEETDRAAEIKIEVNKRKLQDMEIKHKTLRKLDLEILKLEREVTFFSAHCNHDCNTMTHILVHGAIANAGASRKRNRAWLRQFR